MCVCVYVVKTFYTNPQHTHTCWHGCGSRGEAHRHPVQWDNGRKARALWVMLLINSIQQTLRSYDYLSRTALLSPAMLIIVVSLGGVVLSLFYFSWHLSSVALFPHLIPYHLLSNHQNSLLPDESLKIKWSNGWLTRDNKMKRSLAWITLFCLDFSCNPTSVPDSISTDLAQTLFLNDKQRNRCQIR